MTRNVNENAGAGAGQGHPNTMRLQRYLARAGVASRRGSEDLMTAGRVTVNGQVATELGTKVNTETDCVEVDGKPVHFGDAPVYLLLNKPYGVLTTMSDPQGRPCVASLVPTEQYPGLFPVGRLDKDTTGVLLFTTDGDLAQSLLHPSKHVWKTYKLIADGKMKDMALEPLRRGIELDDGPCQPAIVRILGSSEAAEVFASALRPDSTPIEIKIHEGRKNQVKRMFGRIHHPVLRLHRSDFGGVAVGGIRPGKWRMLSQEEVDLLKGGGVDPTAAARA